MQPEYYTNTIYPQLCEEIEVNGALRQYGLDGQKVTEIYRELISNQLKECEAQGDVAEWKEVAW